MNRLTGIARYEQTIRKSRFIGVCGPVEYEPDARAFIDRHGEKGCRHVCFAWRAAEVIRFDDAGEPGGTAGRPILAALEHFELDRAIVVVSRYFGGIKLGTGGLARAYGGTAMEVLARAPIEPIVEVQRLICEVPFEAAGNLHQLAERHGAQKHGEEWSECGLNLELEMQSTAVDTFIEELTSVTHGEALVHTP